MTDSNNLAVSHKQRHPKATMAPAKYSLGALPKNTHNKYAREGHPIDINQITYFLQLHQATDVRA
jgi:hypothetical protein